MKSESAGFIYQVSGFTEGLRTLSFCYFGLFCFSFDLFFCERRGLVDAKFFFSFLKILEVIFWKGFVGVR